MARKTTNEQVMFWEGVWVYPSDVTKVFVLWEMLAVDFNCKRVYLAVANTLPSFADAKFKAADACKRTEVFHITQWQAS